MTDNSALNRVFWHSRRGMLELDLALMPFVKEVYPNMAEQDQAAYRRLLECEDTELFDWVLQKGRPEDQELADIMDRIIDYAKKPKN